MTRADLRQINCKGDRFPLYTKNVSHLSKIDGLKIIASKDILE